MEVSNKLYGPTVLIPRKVPPAPREWKAWWAPEPFRVTWERKISLAPRDQTVLPRMSSPWPRHHTTPAPPLI